MPLPGEQVPSNAARQLDQRQRPWRAPHAIGPVYETRFDSYDNENQSITRDRCTCSCMPGSQNRSDTGVGPRVVSRQAA
jgi:hypothetical protein